MRFRLLLCAALLAWPPSLPAAGVGGAQGAPQLKERASDSFASERKHKRPITETDLFRFVWVADPQISPDGKRVAFVRVAVKKKKDGYESGVWMVPADGNDSARAFTSGPTDASPRWSPDGKWIAFTRAVEKDGTLRPAQLYVIPAGGGEARALTDLPKGAGSPEWSPDGATLAFTSTTNDKDLAKKARKDAEKKDDPAKDSERESDVRVITRAVYRFNGRGYLDPERPSHVWTVAALGEGSALPVPKQVTKGEFNEDGIAWSPDGAEIYFTSNREKEPYYVSPDSDIYAVPVTGGLRGAEHPPVQEASAGSTPARGKDPRRVVSIDGQIGDFSFSPDSRRIAFRGTLNASPVRSYDQPDLFVVDRAPGATPKNLTTGYDYDVGSGLTGDQRAPRGGRPAGLVWTKDGQVVVGTSERGRANLIRFDAGSGKATPLTTGDHEVMSSTATPDASRFALVISTPIAIGDLFVLDAATGQRRQLTRFNEALFSELSLTAPEEITYPSFDGMKIQTWVQKPPDFDPAKKYPLILNIHGGPHAAYGHTFDHEFQWMAAKGYVVLYPNPRGSSAYGQQFGNVIQYRYPGDDHKDLMAGVDELVRRGYVDPKRLGVTGGSGGGILTNWVVTQTDRFAAAVAQRSISDWTSFWYTADFTLFQPRWFRGAPWEDPADFAARSPITRIAQVETPLMLIEGEVDYRTPPTAGGEQMFRALKFLKKPTVMVRFPDESHELSRSGQPWHRVERLQHIVGWFDKYLQGQKTDAYDVP
jgi:dipeptidyl aminopeptidase/acylaminoacyl peptidase